MQTTPKLEFLDGSKEFAYGFECGKLYSDLSRGHSSVDGFYHQSNSEQIKLIAQAQGYEITNISKPEMDKSSGFVRITFNRRRDARIPGWWMPGR